MGRASRGARARLSRLGSGPLVAACAAVLALSCVVGVVLSLRDGGVELVRSEEQTASSVTEGEQWQDPSEADAVQDDGAQPSTTVVVHVDGAVVSPGVYEVGGDEPRVGDAVEAAGGLAADADTSGINLAAKVADGTKVHVPSVDEGESATGTEGYDAVSSGQQVALGSGSAELVNINTADSQELQTLSGVGEATAEAIIRDREQNGPFQSVEDIMRVSGIGEKKFAKLEGSICV